MILHPQEGGDGSVERLRPAIAQYQSMPWSGGTAADLARSWVKRLAPGTNGIQLPRETLYRLSDVITTDLGGEEESVTFKRGTRTDVPAEADDAVRALVETHLPLVQYFVSQSMGWQQSRREFVPVTEDPRPGDPDTSPYSARFKGRFGPLSNLAGPRADWGERFSEVLGAVFLAATSYDGRRRGANFLTHAGYAAEHALYRFVEDGERGVVNIPIERMREVARLETDEARRGSLTPDPRVTYFRRMVAPQPINTRLLPVDNSDIDQDPDPEMVTIADIAANPAGTSSYTHPEQEALRTELVGTIAAALKGIDTEDAKIIGLKYGLEKCGRRGCACHYGQHAHTDYQVGLVTGVSRARIGQRMRRGLNRLRNTAIRSGLEEYRHWVEVQEDDLNGASSTGVIRAPRGYGIEDTDIW